MRCYSAFSGLRTLSYNSTIYTTTGTWTTATDSASSSFVRWNTTSVTMTAETVFFKDGTAKAEPFVVRFKEADFPTSSAASTSSTIQSTATSSETAATETRIINSGLSTGAKAGIGVGACLGVVLLVAIGLAMFWLRRKKRRNDEKSTVTPVWNSETDNAHAPSELPTKWSTAELHAQPMPPKELQASRYREVNPDDPAELGGVSVSRQ
jgi:hypothetical protein